MFTCESDGMPKYERALWTGLGRLMKRTGYDGPLSTPDEIRAALYQFHAVADKYPLCVVWAFLIPNKEKLTMEYEYDKRRSSPPLMDDPEFRNFTRCFSTCGRRQSARRTMSNESGSIWTTPSRRGRQSIEQSMPSSRRTVHRLDQERVDRAVSTC